MFSILQKLATNIFGSKRVGAQITKGKPRFLALEPLEERQLLSVSQFDEEIFGSSYYDEQEQQPYYDDALFSDEAMPGFSEELVPNDTFYEPDDLVFEPEEFSDDMVHGPLTYDEYCMIYARGFFSKTPTMRHPECVLNRKVCRAIAFQATDRRAMIHQTIPPQEAAVSSMAMNMLSRRFPMWSVPATAF